MKIDNVRGIGAEESLKAILHLAEQDYTLFYG